MNNNSPLLVLAGFVMTIVFVAIIVIVGGGGSSNENTGIIEHETTTGIEYETLVIEGMPCVLWQGGGSKNGYAGLTCNWDHWTGSKGAWVDDRQ